MFEIGLLDEWWKKVHLSSVNGRSHDDCDAMNDDMYNYFVERQKAIWTPSELYDKSCPRSLAGAALRRNKSGQFVCGRGCRKIHPIITLYFDAEKNCTVAVLSCRLDPFKNYFDQCVNEGNAVWISPIYCELKGFLREIFHRLRHQQRFFGGHLVKIAIGALNESDAAQRLMMENAYLRQHLKRHHQRCVHCGDHNSPLNAVSITDSNSMNAKPMLNHATEKLEMILEICRLWGLGDILDVLSIHFMLRTSHAFRRVAIHMAEKRVKESKFVITPLVDGHMASGSSVFRRFESDRQTVFEREEGRLVEYAVCSSILYHREADERENDSINPTSINERFHPESGSKLIFNHNPAAYRHDKENGKSAIFSWACEELSYANLELECMNIGVQEYVGQKLIIQWKCKDIDHSDHANQIRKKVEKVQDSSSFSQSIGSTIPVLRLKLDWALQKKGITKVSIPHFDLKVVIHKNSISQIDDVTLFYEGQAEILECRADFSFLVAVYARSLESRLRETKKQIERIRPLLFHEHAFLEEVQHVASLCPFPNV